MRLWSRLLDEGGWGRVWTGLGMAIALAGGGLIYQQVTSPAGACEAPTCFPDASNTGVPDGTSLTAYTGPTTITADDTVIDSKTVTDCLVIQAQNVTITNSLIEPTGCSFVIELFDPTPPSSYSLTIQDSTIDCNVSGGTGLAVNNTVAERLDIFACENGVDIAYDVTVRDSYIHDLDSPPGDPHLDGIQASWGNGALIEHNTILSRDTSSIIMTNYDGHPSVDDWTITENLMGAQTVASVSTVVYCPGSAVSNAVISNNRFLSEFPPVGGYSSAECIDAEIAWTNNVIHETDEPIDAGE